MKLQTKILLGFLLGTALGACGDDDEPTPSQNMDATVPALDGALPDAGDASTSAAPLYLVASSVSTTDESTLLLMTGSALDNAALDPQKAQQFAGGGSVTYAHGYYYVAESLPQTITRYTFENGAFVKGPVLSYLSMGIEWFGSYFDMGPDPTRAFFVDGFTNKVYEWNPTTMKQTAAHDISGLSKEGWGHEFRGSFLRSDGKLFMYWAYTNNRTAFLDDFTLGVFDTKTNTLSKVITDPSCPSSAGFGGFFDEQEDLYLIADSFGGFTKAPGFAPKDACVLRIKKGEDTLDPSYKFHPKQALGGSEPWGLYYGGNGRAYTTAIDYAKSGEYSGFELLFAPIHKGFLLDVYNSTATEIPSLPPSGVGFESLRVDGRLLVPRTTGQVRIFDVETSQTTVYEVRPDATFTPLFSLPGTVNRVQRTR